MAESTKARWSQHLPFWLALLGGHLAWTAHLLLSFFLVPVVCASGLGILPHLITLLCALGALAAAVASLRYWARADAAGRPPHGWPDRPVRYLAFSGFILNGLFLYAILMQGVPGLLLNPCA
jgi:hypothetical protein